MRRYDPFVDLPADVLREIGMRLKVLDHTFVSMLAVRERLAGEVVFAKGRQDNGDGNGGSPIYNRERELERLAGIRAIATDYGIDPDFVAGLEYAIIGESCKTQMKITQGVGNNGYGDLSPETLKRNLAALTSHVAPEYDERFSDGYPATQMYLAFEAEIIAGEVSKLSTLDRALDIGCATGRISFQLAGTFGNVDGIDFSAAMAERARVLAAERGIANTEFHVGDVEEDSSWSNFAPGSFDLVVMGLGTAGDIKEIETVVKQIQTVLKPGGRFVLSFYNTNGLLYRCPFIPWSSSLAGVIDPHRKCLEVRVRDQTFSIFAQTHTSEEVERLVGNRMHVDATYTHPSTASMMPREMLALSGEIYDEIQSMDRTLALNGDENGAYVIAVGGRR